MGKILPAPAGSFEWEKEAYLFRQLHNNSLHFASITTLDAQPRKTPHRPTKFAWLMEDIDSDGALGIGDMFPVSPTDLDACYDSFANFPGPGL